MFIVNLHHDGIFIDDPLKYAQEDLKQITYVNFEGMSYEDLREIVRRLVHGLVMRLYYCKINTPLTIGIKKLKTDEDVEKFLTIGYENKWMVGLYVEHFNYDVLDFIGFESNVHDSSEENVVISNVTTTEPFFNKLCSEHGFYRGYIHVLVPAMNNTRVVEYPEGVDIDASFKIKRERLKLMLYRERDVEGGRYASMAPEPKSKPKGKVKSKSKPKAKSGKKVQKKPVTFRMSIVTRSRKDGEWTSKEAEKSVIKGDDLGTSGSLVTYKWIAHQHAKEITIDPFIAYRSWFLGLLHDDLSLQHRASLTVLSDAHKGLLDDMDEIKQINEDAYDYLVQRNPKSWSKAFFELERIVSMSRLAQNLEDSITPSIKIQNWIVYPSGYMEMEVRMGAKSFGVKLQLRKCVCEMWDMIRVPSIHTVAGFMHLNRVLDEGVCHYYSQETWFQTYQHSIRPLYRTRMKHTDNQLPLRPIVRKMLGRPRKKKVKAIGENTSQVSREGRKMTCSSCYTVAFGKYLDGIHVTWARFGKKQGKNTTFQPRDHLRDGVTQCA
nr:hypothetical protein [Tanacetum cinerariifolium]